MYSLPLSCAYSGGGLWGTCPPGVTRAPKKKGKKKGGKKKEKEKEKEKRGKKGKKREKNKKI